MLRISACRASYSALRKASVCLISYSALRIASARSRAYSSSTATLDRAVNEEVFDPKIDRSAICESRELWSRRGESGLYTAVGRAYDSDSSSLLARLLAFFFTRMEEETSGLRAEGLAETISTSSSYEESMRFLPLPAAAGWWALWLLVWMRECRVSSSDREKRFSQLGNEQTKGFSPVCVRMWRV